uniref:Aquaporin SIP2-1 n=1 Tax=Arundo donax TaxID=35708 RepID=A0A0A9FAG9_ARUDO
MSPAPPPSQRGRIRPWLVVGDLVLAALWVCAGALVKVAVYGPLGLGGRPEGEGAKVALSILYMFLFAWLEAATGGASYNPLTVLAAALASGGGPAVYLFTAFVRIPAQVVGAIHGVKLIQLAFPNVGKGARLSVGAHHGALAEGLATFMVVMVSVALKKKEMKSFFMKTWITSIWKNTIHILSSDITGGIMNPASAFAWAYARGDHTTFDHLLVYWLAPLQATLLGVWVVTLLTRPNKVKEQEADENKTKKE